MYIIQVDAQFKDQATCAENRWVIDNKQATDRQVERQKEEQVELVRSHP